MSSILTHDTERLLLLSLTWYLQEAMNVLGFTDEQKLSLFKTIAAVLHFGNIEVKQRPREEQAEISNTSGKHYHHVCV